MPVYRSGIAIREDPSAASCIGQGSQHQRGECLEPAVSGQAALGLGCRNGDSTHAPHLGGLLYLPKIRFSAAVTKRQR